METREEILQQTFELTMKYGIRSVSMDDIAKALGISKKTIYQHFENKKHLIREMVSSTIERDEADIKTLISASSSAIDEIVSIARHTLQFLRGISPTIVFDMKKYYGKEWDLIEQHHYSFFYNIIKANINRGKEEGVYKKDINSDIIAKLFADMTNCIADEEMFPLWDYKRDELYKALITYHIRGLVSDKGRDIVKSIDLD
jgi:AcrR family transcriptional regulator